MEINLIDENLTKREKKIIEQLLVRLNANIVDDLEQMWYLMDLVWNDYQCNSKSLDWKRIKKFYSHPVWLLNGLFIEQHDISMRHRNVISDWVVQQGFLNIVDYGGGFGTLSRLIARKNSSMRIDIYEPYPSEFGLKRIAEYENINVIRKLKAKYDCLICTDVLEHVPDPLKNFFMMVQSVKLEGYLVIANAFYPMIECHLPQNFHFRYSFNKFAKMMGLEIIGTLESSHATLFKKTRDIEPNWKRIRHYEEISKHIFPIIEVLITLLRKIKKLITQ